MYRMCRRRRLVLGLDVAWLLLWLLASATRYRPREVTRALEGATLVTIQDLHAYFNSRPGKRRTKPPFSASALRNCAKGGGVVKKTRKGRQ